MDYKKIVAWKKEAVKNIMQEEDEDKVLLHIDKLVSLVLLEFMIKRQKKY